MSHTKHLADLLKVCSILPALVIMPAMAESLSERQVITQDKTYKNLTVDGISSSVANNGGVFYLEDVQDVLLTFKGESKFVNNSILNGGMGAVIGNGWLSTKDADKWNPYTPGGHILFDGDTLFMNNTTNNANGAGAIFNYGIGTVDNPDILFNGEAEFIGNSSTGVSNSFCVGGAAIHHRDGAIVFNDEALFAGNTSASKGGAIMSAGTMLFKGDVVFEDNEASVVGGALAILGGDVAFEDEAAFRNNTAGSGSAIYMDGTDVSVAFKDFALFDRNIGTAAFLNNSSTGSVVFENGVKFYQNTNIKNGTLQNAGDVTLNSGDFVFMYNSGGNGGGLKNAGTVTVDTTGNVLFDTNITKSTGGAVDNSGILTLTAANVSFLGNTSDAGYAGAIFNSGDMSILGATNVFSNNIAKDTGTTKHGGGAIHNRGQTGTTTLVVGTKDSVNVFSGNQSNAHGGAIVARAFDGDTQNSEVVINGDTTFVGNTAALNGGAIWNNVAKSGSTTGTASLAINGEVEFKNNIANGVGGAIFNGSQMTIAKAEFDENIAYGNYAGAIYNSASGDIAKLVAEFDENKVLNDDFAAGGAIVNIGKMGSLTGVFEENAAEATNIALHTSAKGGALYAYAGSVIESVRADFISNYANSGGEAMGGAIVNDGDITKLSQGNYGFVNNSVVAQTNAWAGALYNSQDASINELSANFVGNSAKGTDWAIGGAMVNFGTVNVLSGVYANNSVGVSAKEGYAMGGAIYNANVLNFVGDVEFRNNVVSGARDYAYGGAIYNDGTLNFDANALFANNTVAGGANDIYNAGIINVNKDAVLTLDGGIIGEGSGVINIAHGATMNIGTAVVEQAEINIDGTVVASVLSNRSYGRLFGDINAGQLAELQLNVGAAGSYTIFRDDVDIKVSAGKAYDAAVLEDGTVVITTKSVADIADDAGISTQAAGAVASLANTTSNKAHRVSLALQEALNAGDAAYVEAETAKLNPTDKPVVQAASTSVQNQVLSLTSGRMAGGAVIGRAGGDVRSQENGFWIQGLYNKSKFADQFHGYTRGVALGADTLIDRKWTIGGGLAFNGTDVHARNGAHTSIDTKTLFLYGQYKPSKWFMNATATYSMSEYTENKTVAGVGLGASYDVDAYGAQFMTGYDFATGITTQAGMRYLHIAQDSYVDDRDAQIMATDTDFLTGVAGLKYAFAIENDWAIQLRPELYASVTYDFISDDTATTVVTPGVEAYAVNGNRLSRIGGEFGIGLTAQYKGLEVSFMYDLDLHQDYTSQTGMLKLRAQF